VGRIGWTLTVKSKSWAVKWTSCTGRRNSCTECGTDRTVCRMGLVECRTDRTVCRTGCTESGTDRTVCRTGCTLC